MKYIIYILFFLLSISAYSQDVIESDSLEINDVVQEDETIENELTLAEQEESERREKLVADLSANGAMDEFFILENKDTLVVTRTYGDWSFGFMGVINNSVFGGSLNNLQIPWDNTIPNNTPVPYSTKTSTLVTGGLSVIYQPLFKDWGFQFRLFYDPNTLTAEYIPEESDLEDIFQIQSNINYWGMMASYSHRIPKVNLLGLPFFGPGWKAFGGLELYFLPRETSQVNNIFMNNNEIQVERRFDLNAQPVYGLNFGIEYDWNVGDFYRRMRMYMTPFAMVHINTSMVDDFNSDLVNYKLRVGVSLKLGLDKQSYDTLKFDPNFNRGDQLASLDEAIAVEFAGFYSNQGIEAEIIEYKDISISDVGVSEEPQLKQTEISPDKNVSGELDPDKKETEALEISSRGVINSLKFSSNRPYSLSKDDREYLDRLAEYMNENPGAEIRVEGHTDNTGTPQEQNEIADRRAKRVQDYLVRKGISRNRVLSGSFGGRKPVAGYNPNSAEGRRQNRRVDIIVVQVK